MGNVIVLTVLGIVVAAAIRAMYRDKKSGKSCGCSGNCGNCGNCGGTCGTDKS